MRVFVGALTDEAETPTETPTDDQAAHGKRHPAIMTEM